MAVTTKQDWATLSHAQKVKLLSDSSIEQIAKDYRLGDADESVFRALLAREQVLWEAKNVGAFQYAGNPPTKDIVLGAWRDLDRAEAILELIDNSIDAWSQRRAKYPAKTAKRLDVYLEVDATTGQLTYTDNAGGVSIEKLPNLVIPGYSDTTPLSPTIGSYKTGGKKAIFRLATAVRITTRYWSPAETGGDDAVSVQLDEEWLNNQTDYRFPYAKLRNPAAIEPGQTCYVFQLRREPLSTPWYEDPEALKRIETEIRRTYGLLILRNPAIRIHFLSKEISLQPLADLYDFSGTSGSGIDIRPQRITFDAHLEHDGRPHAVEIEIVLGCRNTTGVRDGGRTWGIDLYGNDRLFVYQDQETFAQLLPKANARQLLRGLVNIKGPNIFIPWDTHKRHLNVDREITELITKHRVIRQFFENWIRVYNEISGRGVTALISKPLPNLFNSEKRDLDIPHSDRVVLDPRKRRGVVFPEKIHRPKVKTTPVSKNDSLKVNIQFTAAEARTVCAWYGIDRDGAQRELAAAIKEDVLKRAAKR